MFPILMDEPDSMKVPATAWQLLQSAWRPAPPRAERRDVRARRLQTRAARAAHYTGGLLPPPGPPSP
ncbi:MAG: hypothetical protein IBJ04_15335 [Hydrogenophaga sp.]|uniref:hypothetical protein n=1 Tax=Hydrogenophaga sp. TaxID=1904254 RepID=UPI00257DAFE1|nr:hypothetical protein [Hydrogenophaga sp.]MBL0945689.1 hypothetical protein [Hydrogenophaga sp.]